MGKIKSKRNGLIIDAVPYTDTSVKLGNGKFAYYVAENGKPAQLESPSDTTGKRKGKKISGGESSLPENDAGVTEDVVEEL